MIPAFLRAIAAQVRDLVKTGRAVHVIEADAVELELIAGLDWDSGIICKCNETTIWGGVEYPTDERNVTPADIACAWLRLSQALTCGQTWNDQEITCQEVLTSDWKRAAVCAEFAVIAGGLHQNPNMKPSDLDCSPYRGTIDGARAAWEFVAYQVVARFSAADLLLAASGQEQHADEIRASLACQDKYRRELEGMK